MKIYISSSKPETEEYTHVSNIMTLDTAALDCEATEIVVKNYLSEFTDAEIKPLLAKILSKLRLDGTITILDNDIDITYMRYDRGDIDLRSLNSIVFGGGVKKCFVNVETVKGLLTQGCKVEQSMLDSESGNFVLKARRVANG